MKRILLLTTTLVVMFLRGSFSKPTEITVRSNTLDTITLVTSNSTVSDVKREQRSPQFGLLGDYGDYLGFNDNSRLGHRRPLHKHHYRPLGTHGCRGYHCGGGLRPGYGQGGASFAAASAGSISGGGWPYGGQSQANAQSASFNFGPYSASFSAAQSLSAGRK